MQTKAHNVGMAEQRVRVPWPPCRNAFRGTAKMYAADERVLSWAKQLMVGDWWGRCLAVALSQLHGA